MVGCYRLGSALDLIVNPRVGSVNPYPDEGEPRLRPKHFDRISAGIGSGLRGVRLWPAAGQTRESGVPDRQTENPRDIFDHDCAPIIRGRTPENLHCQLWRRSYCWGGPTSPWPAKPGPFPHNRLTLKQHWSLEEIPKDWMGSKFCFRGERPSRSDRVGGCQMLLSK